MEQGTFTTCEQVCKLCYTMCGVCLSCLQMSAQSCHIITLNPLQTHAEVGPVRCPLEWMIKRALKID